MGLREQAAADLISILEDASGNRCSITVTNPAGTSAVIYGIANDVGRSIDPGTGMAVTGRQSSVALPTARLLSTGIGLPKAIADAAGKPWRVSFADVRGLVKHFKVQEVMPDEHGVTVCLLEAFKPA